jgi:hypothetical protein
MMRIVLAFTCLGATIGTEESPILDWLKEHGKEVVETAMECKALPAAYKEAWESGCRQKPTPHDMVSFGTWYAIQGLEHMKEKLPDLVRQHFDVLEEVKKLATRELIHTTHKRMRKFCTSPKCYDVSMRLFNATSPCVAGLACLSMSKVVPYESCKIAYGNYMASIMDMVSPCGNQEKLGSKTVYCSELNTDAFYRDAACFMEFKSFTPSTTCTPKCAREWRAMKGLLPNCTKDLNDQTRQMEAALVKLTEDLAKFSTDADFKKSMEKIVSKDFKTYDDVCGQTAQEEVMV